MKKLLKSIPLILLSGMLLLTAACSPGIRLHVSDAEESEIRGTFRVILFGCTALNELETVAFLDREDDAYRFDPYAPDFRYKVYNGLDAAEALRKVNAFLNCNAAFSRLQVARIMLPDGTLAGYELQPLYDPLTYGANRLLYSSYWLEGDRVNILLRLDPVQDRLRRDGSDIDAGP